MWHGQCYANAASKQSIIELDIYDLRLEPRPTAVPGGKKYESIRQYNILVTPAVPVIPMPGYTDAWFRGFELVRCHLGDSRSKRLTSLLVRLYWSICIVYTAILVSPTPCACSHPAPFAHVNVDHMSPASQ